MECLFCKIVGKEIASYIVYENEETLAFLDIHPKAPGHVVVIPKPHVPSLTELPLPRIQPLFEAVQRVRKAIETRLHADACTIGINDGIASGQTVPHLHVHLIPRFKGDGGGFAP